MTEPYILITVVGGIIDDIQHTFPAAIKLIVETSDDSVLDASIRTWNTKPTPPEDVDAAIANTVRELAETYDLPDWTTMTDDQIVAKLLTGEHDMHPSEDEWTIKDAIVALAAGHDVYYNGDYLVSDIDAVAPDQWEIYYYTDPDDNSLGEMATCPGDFTAEDLIFTIRRYGRSHHEEAGDDLCDYCMRSGLQISHTLNGKTICTDCLADRTPDPDCEPVELETVEIQVSALQAAALMRTQFPEDLDMRYEGHPVTALSIHIGATTEATLTYNIVIGNIDTPHEVTIAVDQPVIYVTVPKE